MKTINYLLLILLIAISFVDGKVITPSIYYDLIKYDNYQFPNRVPNDVHHTQQDFYFPDICYNATRNEPIASSFVSIFFPGAYDDYKNLYITKGSNLILKETVGIQPDFLNILCIEGSLTIEPTEEPFFVGAIIILPGGSLISQAPIVIRDLHEEHSLIDPLGFFPGILSLGGSLSLSSSNKIIYPAKRLGNTLLSVPGFVFLEYKTYIFSDFFPLGVQFLVNRFDNGQLGISNVQIAENDGDINVVYNERRSITTQSTTGASIYITDNSNVNIENCYIDSFGKTTNQPYNDAVLVFDQNNTNSVTDIIIGANQRFRASVFIENSNNVNIKGSVIYESKETRSPLVISGSKVNIQGSLIASKSGSSIIAQYGTELISSSNNVFYLSKSTETTSTKQSTSSYMDYGNEGNGIYSLSPNIISTSDTFIGHSNAFNFNFISNRSTVTGYNYDCFAPCTSTSILISSLSQFPIDFKIKTPSFKSLPSSNSSSSNSSSSSSISSSSNEPSNLFNELLFNINNNGNQMTRYFKINGLSLSDSIKLNLNNSVLTLSNVKVTDGFNIQGTVGKLNIIDSTISLPASNSKLSSNSTVISNSFVRGQFGSSIEFNGSPYHYDIENLNVDLPIISTFPIDPYQIAVNETINIMVQLGASTFNGSGINCEFRSNEINSNTSIPVDSSNKCILPLNIKSEGKTNLRVIISSDTTPSTFYYSLIFPTIYSFNNYSLANGWKIALSSTTPPPNSNLKSYVHLVTTSTQVDNQFDKECTKANGCEIISNQIKIESNLPSSNEYLPIGISTSNPLQPLNINLAISKLENNQIQLYFTSFNPIDSNPSPLSIYLNNQQISILETTNQQHFKKLLYFENTNQLETVQLSIISRGDIYLTGAAVYSSFFPPIVIPTIPDIPFSDNFNPKVLYIVIFVGVGLFLVSVAGVLTAFKKHRINVKNRFKVRAIQIEIDLEKRVAHELEMEEIRKKQIYIEENATDTGVSFYTNSEVTELTEVITDTSMFGSSISNNNINSGDSNGSSISISNNNNNNNNNINSSGNSNNNYHYYKTKYLKYKEHNNNNFYYNYNSNNNNNVNYNFSLNEQSAAQFEIEPEIKDNIKKYMKGLRRLYGTFPLNEGSNFQHVISFPTAQQSGGINKNKDRYNISSAILQRTQESNWHPWDSNEFPVSFSKQILHFGYSGRKCQLDKTFYDQIQITNKLDKAIKLMFFLPTDNGAGFCTIANTTLIVDPYQTVKINFAIILHCTTKWYEKFTIRVEGYGHTFLLMHLESVVTTKLDYRELEFDQYVGHGSHGTVYKGRYRSQTIAIKIIRVNIDNISDAYREMDIMSRIRHQNCVQMVGCVASPAHLCIVSQFAKMGSLGDIIHKVGTKLTLKQKVRIALDIAVGCQYLHENGIIHRDLKPENVLIVDLNHEAPVCVRIADFGTCKEIGEVFNPSTHNNIYLTESVGTPIYQSNEVLSKNSYNNSTDVYSFGMSLYELMIEELPFSDHKEVWELPSLIISGVRPTKGMNTFDNDISSLVTKCWSPVSTDRPSFSQVVTDLRSIAERLNIDYYY